MEIFTYTENDRKVWGIVLTKGAENLSVVSSVNKNLFLSFEQIDRQERHCFLEEQSLQDN